MAAPRRLPTAQNKNWRQAIDTAKLIKKLQGHALGELLKDSEFKKYHMTATQIKAAELLLARTVATLQSVQIVGDPDEPLQLNSDVNIKVDPATRKAIIDDILSRI